MEKFLSLLKINLKLDLTAFFANFGNSKKKNKKKGAFSKMGLPLKIVLLIALFIPLEVTFGISGYKLMQSAVDLNLPTLPISQVAFAGTLLCFLMSFAYTPASFFFSNDIQNYMVLPIHPREILAVKIISVLIEQYYTLVIFIMPIAIGMLAADFSIANLLIWLLILIFIPAFPTILASILLLLVLQVLPALRDKNKLTILTGLISMILGFGMAIGIQFLNPVTDNNKLAELLSGGDIFGKYYKIFPPLLGINKILAGHVLPGLLIFIGSIVLIFLLFILIGEKFYMRIALSVNSSSTKAKKMNEDARSKALAGKNSNLATLIKREIIVLLRTPVYFLNGFLPALIIPFVLILIFLVAVLAQGIAFKEVVSGIYLLLDTIKDDPKLQITCGLIGGIGISMFGISTSLVATSISRDAKHLAFFKSMPIKASNYFMAKIFPGFILNILTLIVYICIVIYFTYSMPLIIITMAVASLLTGYTLNLSALWIDILKPSLNWTNETQAIKSNFNAGIGALLSMGLFYALLILGFILKPDLTVYIGTIFGIIVILGIVETIILNRTAERRLDNIDIG